MSKRIFTDGFQEDGLMLEDTDDYQQLFLQLEEVIHHTDHIMIKNPSNKKMLNSCIDSFLDKYQEIIKMVIKSYSDDYITHILLKNLEMDKHDDYSEIEQEYDEKYYLTNCGGYQEFNDSNGEMIAPRLSMVLNLVDVSNQDRILDIGCGRGELTYAMANCGAQVLGVDYSEDAIRIAIRTYEGTKEYREKRLKYLKKDVLQFDESEKYTKIVMADVYEHIQPDVMEQLLKKITNLLAEDGMLIIHTAPNLDWYHTVYPNLVADAARHQQFLPNNPRSRYEDRMHINEQSPETLNTTLIKYFSSVFVWTGELNTVDKIENPDKYPIENDITAIACMHVTDNLFNYGPLNSEKVDVDLKLDVCELECSGSSIEVLLHIKNNGEETLKSKEPNPVRISYHILDQRNNTIIYDGIRTMLKGKISKNETISENMLVDLTGLSKGTYILRADLVQEGCFWFYDVMGKTAPSCVIHIK